MPNTIEKCEICGKTSKDASIVSAVLDKDILRICEMCALVEGAIVAQKPTREQLNEADRPFTVHERLVRASGVDIKSASIAKAKDHNGVSLSSLQNEWLKRKEQESKGKTEGRIPEKQDIKETTGKKFDIDFRSKNLKIGDLKGMRDRFFVDKKEEKIENKEYKRGNDPAK